MGEFETIVSKLLAIKNNGDLELRVKKTADNYEISYKNRKPKEVEPISTFVCGFDTGSCEEDA